MVVTVLIICGDTVWLGVGRQRHEEGHNTAQGTTTAAARPSTASAPFSYIRLGRRKAFQRALATLSLSSENWAGGRCWQLPWEGVRAILNSKPWWKPRNPDAVPTTFLLLLFLLRIGILPSHAHSLGAGQTWSPARAGFPASTNTRSWRTNPTCVGDRRRTGGADAVGPGHYAAFAGIFHEEGWKKSVPGSAPNAGCDRAQGREGCSRAAAATH